MDDMIMIVNTIASVSSIQFFIYTKPSIPDEAFAILFFGEVLCFVLCWDLVSIGHNPC